MTFCKLLSQQGENLPLIPHSDYPRPQLVRKSYICLNGKWSFGVGTREIYSQEIIVPFPPESILSGVNKVFPEKCNLYYKREFTLPENFIKGKVLLHFGAVDQTAKVYLNEIEVGSHIGGYTPFCFDITKYLKDKNVLKVKVRDNLSDLILPYGKQSRKRGGMWYTPTSGIWQTVWLESVPDEYIKSIKADVSLNKVTLSFEGIKNGFCTLDENNQTYPIENGKAEFDLQNPVLWSPENPYLYTFTAKSGEDEIKSYFAIRTISIENINGTKRICLKAFPIRDFLKH